ncbi:MAG: hypothetical protein BGO21_24550 [Dyadobacter sp. 50-39]|nr:MAG: hypothetical protein BGO21_24550 [Dyadobacter sp. 50-39]
MASMKIPPDNIKQAVPFLWVSDLNNSLLFYTNGLGFRITNQWAPEGNIEWCFLESGGAALMLQQIRKDRLEHWLELGKPGHGISIFFVCNDALAVYLDVIAKGITVERPFVGNGMWVVSMIDPDGYRIEFESKTTEKEGTQYVDYI